MADPLATSDDSDEFLTEDEGESADLDDLRPDFATFMLNAGGNSDEDEDDDDDEEGERDPYGDEENDDSDEDVPYAPPQIPPGLRGLLGGAVPPPGVTVPPPGVVSPTRGTGGGRTIMAPALGVPPPTVKLGPIPPPTVAPRLQLNVQPAVGVPPPTVPPPTVAVPAIVPPPTVAAPAPARVSPEELATKLAGITIDGITPATNPVAPDINDLLHKEASESDEDFEARRRLTLRLAAIENYHLNNATAVVLGHMMMRKSRLGIKYDTDIEAGINQVLKLVE